MQVAKRDAIELPCPVALPRIVRFFFKPTPHPSKKILFSSYLKQATEKIPESKISKPKISSDHHLKSGVPIEVVMMYFYAVCCEARTPTEP